MRPLFLSILLEEFADPTPRSRNRESFRRPKPEGPSSRARVRHSINNPPPDFGDQSELMRTDLDKYSQKKADDSTKFVRWFKRTAEQRKRKNARLEKLRDQERRETILAKIKHDKRRGRRTAKLMAQNPDPESRSPAQKRMIKLNTGRNRAGPGHPNYDPGHGSLTKRLGFKIRDPEDK